MVNKKKQVKEKNVLKKIIEINLF